MYVRINTEELKKILKKHFKKKVSIYRICIRDEEYFDEDFDLELELK